MVTIIIVGIGSAVYTQKNDGPVEEACETIIEKELNLPDGTVDLTPDGTNKSTSQV